MPYLPTLCNYGKNGWIEKLGNVNVICQVDSLYWNVTVFIYVQINH